MKRLEAEGRLLDYEKTDQRGHGTADCNFVPKQMTLEELRLGHGWLMRSLYRYDSFGERLVGVLSRFQNPDKEHKRATFSPKLMVRLDHGLPTHGVFQPRCYGRRGRRPVLNREVAEFLSVDGVLSFVTRIRVANAGYTGRSRPHAPAVCPARVRST
jgi:hypothetical protein